jgi:Reverse transcriptase (RNA-dependent DNA polymerase)
VFYCFIYFYINEGKLELKAKKYVFVGYLMNVKEYKIWCHKISKFLILRDVTFDESIMLKARDGAFEPARYDFPEFAYCLAIAEDLDSCESSYYKEVISSKNATDWVTIMNEELTLLQHNQTWTLVKPPSDKRVMGCKWIFKKKINVSSLRDIRYKAKFVPNDYCQVEGVDFNDVFSLMLSLVAVKDLE